MKKAKTSFERRAIINKALCFALSAVVMPLGISLNAFTAKADETKSDEAATIRMTQTEGDVLVKDSTGKEVSKVDNMRMYSGNRIITDEESYAYFNLDDTKAVKLIDLSDAEIRQKNQKLQLLLNSGELFLDVKEKLDKKQTLSVRSSNLVMGIRGTDVSAKVEGKNKISANCYKGLSHFKLSNLETGEVTELELKGGKTVNIDLGNGQGGKINAEIVDTDPESVSGAVIEELRKDGLAEKILEETGIDYTKYSDKDIQEKKIKESGDRAKRNKDVKKAEQEQDNNKNTEDGVWEKIGSSGGQSKRPQRTNPQPATQTQIPTGGTETTGSESGNSNASSGSSDSGRSDTPREDSGNNEENEAKTYTISVGASKNGTVKVDEKAVPGDTVTIIVTPNDGYKLEDIIVTKKSNNETIDTNEKSKKKYTFTMPDGNVKVKAYFEKIDYSVTVNSSEHGKVTADKTTAGINDTVTLTATPDEGYELSEISASSDSGALSLAGDGNTRTLTMPAGNVTVSATFTATAPTTYSITVNTVEHGSITADKTSASKDETVTLTATPEDGYVLSAISVISSSGEVSVSGDGNSRTFTMPGEDVTVSGTFTALPPTYTVTLDAMHGSLTADKTTAVEGETVTLTATPDDGYELEFIHVSGDSGEVTLSGEGNTRTFTMPAEDVYATAEFLPIEYTITLVNDNLEASASTSAANEQVTITAPCYANGSYFVSMTASYSGGDVAVTITKVSGAIDSGNVTGTITMPAGDVTISATYTEETCIIDSPGEGESFFGEGGVVGQVELSLYGQNVEFADGSTAAYGWTVPAGCTVKIIPTITNDAYHITSVNISQNQNELPVTDNGDGTYSFTAVAGDVNFNITVSDV